MRRRPPLPHKALRLLLPLLVLCLAGSQASAFDVNGALTVAGPLTIASRKDTVTTVTGDTTLGAHNVIACNAASGGIVLTLPSAASTLVGTYHIVKIDSSANACQVARAGSDTLNGLTPNISVSTQWAQLRVTLLDNGSPGNWQVVFLKAQPDSGIGSSTASFLAYYSATSTVSGSSALTANATEILTQNHKVTSVSGNATLGTHNILACNATTAPVTLTLPSATSSTTGSYRVIKIDSSTNACQVARAGSDTINGATSNATLTTQWGELTVTRTDSGSPGNWQVITAKASIGSKNLPVGAPQLPTTNAAYVDSAEDHIRLVYDDTSAVCAWWQFPMPRDYAISGPLLLNMDYTMASATSGSVNFDVTVRAISSGDATAVNGASYGTNNDCNDSAVPGTAGRPKRITCTLSNTQSLAPGDDTWIKVCSDTAGTATGFSEIINLELEYIRN